MNVLGMVLGTHERARYGPGHTLMCRVWFWAHMNVLGMVLGTHERARYGPGHT